MENKRGKWKSQKRLPKILKINRIHELTLSVLFNDGQDRVLDFEKIHKNEWKTTKKDPEYKLSDPNEFKKVKLEDFTLVWPNILTELTGFDGKKIKLPYSVGADVLYELSEPDFR